eukprot:TRINITY_DN1630_c0_g3_i1.p1 TRINITY_DN1630_c0_g3~~TRINITY_DN1630_c0_g3_i1.p1  ORF type:complete len:423 (-),score=67.54 TRINITY_DN1630_c0_g3_i1:543-1811(-)
MSASEQLGSKGADPTASTATTGSIKSLADDAKSVQAEEVMAKWRSQAPGRLVLLSGVMLAGIAGFVNATASLTCGSLVSHVTGTSAKLGMALEGYYTDEEDLHKVYQFSLLLVSFLIGATACGTLVSRNEVHFGKSAYGLALTLNCTLLLTALGVHKAGVPDHYPEYLTNQWIAAYLLSMACGLQNGMCTAHFGAVVRTTHLTGLATDSGLTIGRILNILIRARCSRRNFCPLDWAELTADCEKQLVFCSLFTGYVLGCISGASAAGAMDIDALIIPASITGIGGLSYAIAKAKFRQAFERADADKLARDLCEAEEIFERARCWSALSRSASSANLEELDDEVGKALHLMQDMEACLHERLRKRSTVGGGATPAALKEIMQELEAKRGCSLFSTDSDESEGKQRKSGQKLEANSASDSTEAP